MKISINDRIKEVIIILIELPLLYTVYIMTGSNSDILFWGNMILMLQIVAKCQFSFLSLIGIISNYILISLFMKNNDELVYGILNWLTDVNFDECMKYSILFNIVIYIFSCFTSFLEREKQLLKKGYRLNSITVHICCLAAICSVVIAFPRIPFQGFGSARFEALLPGHFWNHLCIVFLIVLLPMLKGNRKILVTYVICVFWFLSHYERVDVIGLICGIIVYFAIQKNLSINSKTILKYGIMIIGILIVLVYLGEVRVGSEISGLDNLIQKIVNQNTASDIAYVYHSSVQYTKQYGFLHGQTYLTYLQNLIPLTDSDYRAGEIIKSIYSTPGGEFILTEPLINFGTIGVIVIPCIYLLILNKLISKPHIYRFILYLFLLCCSYRIIWYGLLYIETGVVFLIPMVYLMCKILNKKIKLE